jgi:hypothetical protein
VVTLARATLAVGVAALVADSFARTVSVARILAGWPRAFDARPARASWLLGGGQLRRDRRGST